MIYGSGNCLGMRKSHLIFRGIGTNRVKFPRFVLDESVPAKLIIFCDASQLAFGFAAYVWQKGCAKLIFAKAKVAPLVKRTLPTLELLSVFLAFKCVPNMLRALPDSSISDIVVAVDAQVALSWLLTNDIKTKNVFVGNRLKDIHAGIAKLRNGGVHVSFKYVNTNDNPADLITRGVSIDKFETQLLFWIHGPSWLEGEAIQWPASELGCLSADSRRLVLNNAVIISPVGSTSTTVVELERFSSLDKLLRVLTYVFRFIFKLRGGHPIRF